MSRSALSLYPRNKNLLQLRLNSTLLQLILFKLGISECHMSFIGVRVVSFNLACPCFFFFLVWGVGVGSIFYLGANLELGQLAHLIRPNQWCCLSLSISSHESQCSISIFILSNPSSKKNNMIRIPISREFPKVYKEFLSAMPCPRECLLASESFHWPSTTICISLLFLGYTQLEKI